MKRIFAALIVAYCFTGHLTAQALTVVSAVENGTVHGPGMALPNNIQPKYTYNINYTITLGYQKLNSIVLDSLYLGNITTGLSINGNVRTDTLHHTFTIVIHTSCDINGIVPGSGRETERHRIATNLIVYELKGKKYILPIKGITVGHLIWPC